MTNPVHEVTESIESLLASYRPANGPELAAAIWEYENLGVALRNAVDNLSRFVEEETAIPDSVAENLAVLAKRANEFGEQASNTFIDMQHTCKFWLEQVDD